MARSMFWTAAVVLLAAFGVALGQQSPAGSYTAQQATLGRAGYESNCGGCHRTDLGGSNEAPQLAGSNFLNSWRARSVADLFTRVQSTMPG